MAGKAAASWFPGHMAAGARAVASLSQLVDAVVEVRDARLPRATAVAPLHAKLRAKPAFILLNRADLADPQATQAWLASLRGSGRAAFAGVGTSAASLRALRSALLTSPRRRGKLKIAVIGAPNTGKSSVINALAHRKRAIAQDRAGVTRHVRWLRCADGVEVLDTPGVLAPKIVDAEVAWQLALCGSLPEAAFDPEAVAESFVAWLRPRRADLAARLDLQTFAGAHGMKRRGGELDRRGAARKLVTMFRSGAFGRFTFELPEARS